MAILLKMLLAGLLAVLLYLGARAGWSQSEWFGAGILILALLGGLWIVAMRRNSYR